MNAAYITSVAYVSYGLKWGNPYRNLDEFYEEEETIVKAELLWNDKVGAYTLHFASTRRGDFGHIKELVELLKGTIPSHERDYKPAEYKWYLEEKWGKLIYTLVEAKLGKDNVFFFEKPDESFSSSTPQVSTDADLNKFRELLVQASVVNGNTQNVVTIEAMNKWTREEATKYYRKAAFFYHPDRDPKNATTMSSLNEVWNRLKEVYFKGEQK